MKSNRFLLLASVAMTLLCSCAGEKAGSEEREPPVASVDGTIITLSEFKRRWSIVSAQGDPESLPIADRKKIQESLLERMIDETILLNKAREINIVPTNEEVSRAVEEMKSGYPQQNAFNEQLGKSLITPSILRDRVARHAAIKKLLSQEVHKRILVTEKEIKEHYENNIAEFSLPEQVEASIITVNTEEEAGRVYDKLKKENMPFAEAARQYSVSPEAANNGFLGKFSRGVMPPAFDETCFNMPPNTFSKPVTSDFGFHIFFLHAKHPARTASFEEARKGIEIKLMAARASKAEKEYLSGLKNKAKIKRYLENIKNID